MRIRAGGRGGDLSEPPRSIGPSLFPVSVFDVFDRFFLLFMSLFSLRHTLRLPFLRYPYPLIPCIDKTFKSLCCL